MIEANKKIRFDGLDFLKFLACISVVFIHCKFPGVFGEYMKTTGRTAVPFFLMVSGYFCANRSLQIELVSLKKKSIHILNLILFSLAFYSVYHILINYVINHSTPIEVALGYVNTFDLKKLIIINTPSHYLHLWFLFALLYCYLLLYPAFIRRAILHKQIILTTISLTILVFVLSSEILPLLGKEIKVLGYKSQHVFLFRALPFFLIGLYTRLFQPLKNIKTNTLLIVALLGIGLSFIEHHFQVQDSQAYIGSILCSYSMLLYGLRCHRVFPKRAVKWGEKLSLYVYIYHIAVISISGYISPSEWLTPIIVVILSFIMAGITVYARDYIFERIRSKVS